MLFVRACTSWTAQARTTLGARTRTVRPIRPASTMVVVAGLIDPRLLVEIEVDACRPASPSDDYAERTVARCGSSTNGSGTSTTCRLLPRWLIPR